MTASVKIHVCPILVCKVITTYIFTFAWFCVRLNIFNVFFPHLLECDMN